MPGGDAQLRVVASDGMLSAMDTSDPFFIERKPPTVNIISPEDGATYFPAQLVTFQGRAYDAEDGQLGGSDLSWSSSVDGDLGTGTVTSTVNLSTGEHVIALRATDSFGQWTEVQRTITVLSSTAAEPDVLEVAPTSVGAVLQPTDEATDRTITIRNGGEGELDWSATEDTEAEWLELSALSGTSPSELIFNIDPSGLSPGSYTTSVTFTSAGASNSPVTIPVTLEIPALVSWEIYLPLVMR